MEKIYQENLLISLLYNELEALDRLEMEYALSMDSMSQQAYRDYHTMKKELSSIVYSPKSSTINDILAYVQA